MAKDTAKTNEPELDASGRLANPVYINGLQQTTRFTTAELPANAAARAAFPKHLIDDSNVTESPASDALPASRAAAAKRAIATEVARVEAEYERIKDTLDGAKAAEDEVGSPEPEDASAPVAENTEAAPASTDANIGA